MLQIQGHAGHPRADHAGVTPSQSLPASASLDRQFEIPENTGGSWTPSKSADQAKHAEDQTILRDVALEGRLDSVPVQHIPQCELVQSRTQTGEQLAETERSQIRPHLEAAPLQSEIANDSKYAGWLHRGKHPTQLSAIQWVP